MNDIDFLIDNFLENNKNGIHTICSTLLNNNDPIFIKSLISDLIPELKLGCIHFFNKEYDILELDSYLFYITNDFCKNKSCNIIKKKNEYHCPGCLFLGIKTEISFNNIFNCKNCSERLMDCADSKQVKLFKTFYVHNKNGYRCKGCDRFIPHPLDTSMTISCPYFDCYFVGIWSSLKRMAHPTAESISEIEITIKPIIKNNQISILKNIIESEKNNILYSSSEFTVKHKTLCYQAFLNYLDRKPDELIDYLLNNSRSGGFQQKIFQEYILLLENSLPYSFKKNNKIYKVESLLDEQLCLFDGISVFNGIVSDKLEIKNNTQEFYIGGRKAAYTKPFYIGKLLDVEDKLSKKSLLNVVDDYGFSKIKMKDIVPGTEVTVTHLRVPPHYQMGGMVYVNRVRKKIVDSYKEKNV